MLLHLPLALLNLASSFPHTKSFFKSLEVLENPSYINVMKMGDCHQLVDLLSAFQRPIVITDTSSLLKANGTFNYLNLPRYNGVASVKFYFNRSFLTVILLDELSKISGRFTSHMLNFNRHITTLIISANENTQVLMKMMKMFYKNNFLNVMHLDIGSFGDTQTITTYDSFPGFTPILRQFHEKENVKNVRQRQVSVAYFNVPPLVLLGKQEVVGILGHFYKNFVRFVNGTLIYRTSKVDSSSTSPKALMDLHRKFDFLVGVPLIPLKGYLKTYPLSSEMMSNALDSSELNIFIPKAKPTEKELYLVKIFSIDIWILTLIFVLCASGVFSIHFWITKKNVQFGRTFCQLFRCSLGQCFPNPDTFSWTSTFYFIPLLFGFILTVWFSAILGSFVTTTLYDKQARTLDDMRIQNIKIATANNKLPSEVFENSDKFRDIAVVTDLHEAENDSLDKNSLNYALLFISHWWYYYKLPLMNFYSYQNHYILSDFVVETSFLRVVFDKNSIFKEPVNRYIELVKDTGLLKHWCDMAYIEILQLKMHNYSFQTEKSSIQVLQLNFFTYPFYILAAGLILASISFVFEIAPKVISYLKEIVLRLF